MRAALASAVVGLLLVVAVWACTAERVSPAFACSDQSECDPGRVCTQGYCVVGRPDAGPADARECPSVCDSCDLPSLTCTITGDGSAVSCPSGWNCDIHCPTPGSCDSITCTAGTSCDITCGAGACGDARHDPVLLHEQRERQVLGGHLGVALRSGQITGVREGFLRLDGELVGAHGQVSPIYRVWRRRIRSSTGGWVWNSDCNERPKLATGATM